jgi:hypothetical protein
MFLRRLKIKLNTQAITLSELLISIMIIGMMIISFYSLETFSHEKVISSDRRTKVQNALAYSMDSMGKTVLMANGNNNNPPIRLYPNVGSPKTGFEVRVDLHNPQTPTDLTDDTWVYFSLTGNQLIGNGEVLTSKILANFNNSAMPASPTDGFYVLIDNTVGLTSGYSIEVGLFGRYDPAEAYNRTTNPQVAMKTKLFCNNSSSN